MRYEIFGYPDDDDPDEGPGENEIITDSGFTMPVYPQSAAVELTEEEFTRSLAIAKDVVDRLAADFPSADIGILYLPSPATTYDFAGDLKVQSYKDDRFFKTTRELNLANSRRIRRELREYCAASRNCGFCDATDAIRDTAASGLALHGPIDWKHPNALGYETIHRSLSDCTER